MRTKYVIKNIYISLVTQLIITFLGFLSRKVFLDSLGTEYLGINGLLTNILSLLSLVEGGMGASIIYNMYKPLADNDIPKITALVQLYKKLYTVLVAGILFLGILLYPFLGMLIKGGADIPYLFIVYFIFIIKNAISYLNAHKWSLINADQKGYIIAKYNLIFNIITTICKIIILKTTRNYLLFLLIEVFIFIIQNIWNGIVVNNKYSYIKSSKKYKVDEETKNNLITNVKAIFLHNIGSYCVLGTDNLLISSFISLKMVGLYSNYTMIIGQLSSFLTPILSGIGSSVGNLIAVESKEKNYEVFKVTYFINFWIYSLCVIFLYNLLEPFINWWLGDNLLLDKLSFIFILINFYLLGLRVSINMFKTKAGIFTKDKYCPVIESIINLGSSIILVKYFGLAGIFMGTTLSTILVPLWVQSKLVYNNVFDKSVIFYFKRYFIYMALTLGVGFITTSICRLFVLEIGFISLITKVFICITIPNIIYLIIFFKTEEFQYVFNLLKSIILQTKYKVNTVDN